MGGGRVVLLAVLAVCVPWRVLIFLTARTCICVTRCTNVSASGSRVQVPPRQEGCAGKLEPQCAQNSTEGWHVALKAASATMSSMMHAGAPRPLTILRGRFRMHRHALSDGDRPSCPAGADCALCSKERNGPPFFFRLTGEPARFLAQFFNLNYSDYTEIHLLKRETLALINDASTDLSLRGLLCPLRGKASEFLHPKSSLTASCACACICDDVYRYQKMSPQATFGA